MAHCPRLLGVAEPFEFATKGGDDELLADLAEQPAAIVVIIKTVLLRFCRRADGTIPDMGARVMNARHAGGLLTLPAAREPTAPAAYQHLIDRIAQWRADVRRARLLLQARGVAPTHPALTDLQ